MYSRRESTQGTETSKYLEEEKETSIPLVAASERGTGQTGLRPGVADHNMVAERLTELSGKAGQSG